MDDYWLGFGCTSWGFERQDPTWKCSNAEVRRDYLKRQHQKDFSEIGTWPFVHSQCHIDDPWFKGEPSDDLLRAMSWGLDPLVIPLLRKLNSLPGVKTYVSCQGNAYYGPNIEFLGDLAAAHAVQQIFIQWEKRRDHYWNNVLVALTGKRQVKWEYKTDKGIGEFFDSWHIWFYDTLSLMQFTRDCLGISVEQQVKSDYNFFATLPADFTHPVADPQEIEDILNFEKRIG